jgi:hypothetical protein
LSDEAIKFGFGHGSHQRSLAEVGWRRFRRSLQRYISLSDPVAVVKTVAGSREIEDSALQEKKGLEGEGKKKERAKGWSE